MPSYLLFNLSSFHMPICKDCKIYDRNLCLYFFILTFYLSLKYINRNYLCLKDLIFYVLLLYYHDYPIIKYLVYYLLFRINLLFYA